VLLNVVNPYLHCSFSIIANWGGNKPMNEKDNENEHLIRMRQNYEIAFANGFLRLVQISASDRIHREREAIWRKCDGIRLRARLRKKHAEIRVHIEYQRLLRRNRWWIYPVSYMLFVSSMGLARYLGQELL